ncbi:MAG: VCBS repeat-containing protein [Opitutaceae bacterium]|nr:VCBS repeat-containing protein [Verrucomicrobiales bacterium]
MAVALPCFSPAAAAEFTITNIPLPSVAYSSVAFGDFNNDGKPDVLLTGADSSFAVICQLWQNGSSSGFTNLGVGFPGVSSSAVARGDFDNDGRTDLLITGYTGQDGGNRPLYVSQVWRNLGNGTFTNIQAGLPGVDTGAVALGDLDSDGNLDILLTGYSSTGAVAQVWRNVGNGTFTNLNVGLPGVFYSSVAWGDYDSDGRLDILLTGTPNGFLSTAVSQVWRNLGNGSFAKLNIALPGVLQGAVAWGDFDLDGRLDILLTGNASTGVVSQVWHNLGNGSFTNVNVSLPAVHQSSVALADFDNDGDLDIALGGVDAQTNLVSQVWRNTGNGAFTNLNAGLPGLRLGSIAWADLDTDGRLDLLVTGQNVGGIPILRVYHNGTAVSSTSAPRLNRLKTLPNGGYQLSFNSEPGFGYRVWASTNFIQWTSLGAPNDGNPGTHQFSAVDAPDFRHRFFRVSRP